MVGSKGQSTHPRCHMTTYSVGLPILIRAWLLEIVIVPLADFITSVSRADTFVWSSSESFLAWGRRA